MICNTVDAVPDNYKFFLDSQFTEMPQLYGDEIQGLKELYAFRMMLEAKAVAYKQAIGHEPDYDQPKQIMYVCMGMGSKSLASQSGLHRKGYVDICKDIDRRYRLQFEGLGFAKAAKGDDPMGVSNIFGNEDGKTGGSQAAPAEPEPPLREDLDAFGQGKGRGKNDGK